MSSWVPVSEADARAHPLYGVKGWLVLLAVGLALGPLRSIAETLKDPVAQDVLDQFPWLPTMLAVEFACVAAIGLYSWVLCWALVTQKPWFPTGYLVFAAVIVAFPILDTAATLAVFSAHGYDLGFGDVLDPRSLLLAFPAVLWSLYVVNSRRVNVTYRHRVRDS